MTTFDSKPSPPPAPESVTGVQLAQGIGVQEARGFWADAWSQVLRRKTAVLAICWIGIVAVLGIFAPLLANGHPLVVHDLRDGAPTGAVTSPLLRNLSTVDVALLIVGFVGLPYVVIGARRGLGRRAGTVLFGLLLSGLALLIASAFEDWALGSSAPEWVRGVRRENWFPFVVVGGVSTLVIGVVLLLVTFVPVLARVRVGLVGLVIATVAGGWGWSQPLQRFNYLERELRGEIRATYAPVPFSPQQRFSELDRVPPQTTLGEGLELEPDAPGRSRTFVLGSDALGQDVLSQLIHGCRLAISIGLVSTGIAMLVGITLGSIAGYFGGVADILIQRLIEIFMAVPVLFLLIVAAGVLPAELRNVYVTMAIIGLVTWTTIARFTRAEFYRLRSQDFVQAAKAMGLPLRSILFKHMLPNGVTPVLVDASFAIAAAILAEATLSYLGLGPIDTASWGKLLSSAMNVEGVFKWWLAVFPGLAIFLTVLSYNLLGEALRDAIDPKLKKARV